MKHRKFIRTGALGLLGCAALGVAFQAGRHGSAPQMRAVEKASMKTPVHADAPLAVPVPVPVAVPFAIEVRGRPPEAISPALAGAATESAVAVDPDLCVQPAADGGRVVWFREKDRTSITKYDFAADGSLSFLTDLRIDPKGNPLSAKVYNGQNELLYKASYGYSKTTGTLVAELLFDPMAALPGQKAVPVRRVSYSTDERAGEVIDIQPAPAMAENEPQVLPAPFTSWAFPDGE